MEYVQIERQTLIDYQNRTLHSSASLVTGLSNSDHDLHFVNLIRMTFTKFLCVTHRLMIIGYSLLDMNNEKHRKEVYSFSLCDEPRSSSEVSRSMRRDDAVI